MEDKAILSGNAFLVNVFQWGGVKKISLTLYPSHLQIVNTKKDEVIDDVSINEITKIRKVSSSGSIVIVTAKGKHYRISWKNIDMEKIALGSGVGSLVNAVRGNPTSDEWIEAINKLKGS